MTHTRGEPRLSCPKTANKKYQSWKGVGELWRYQVSSVSCAASGSDQDFLHPTQCIKDLCQLYQR